MIPKDSKSLSQQRFGQFASSYTHSTRHFKGAELSHLVELADPEPDWLMLDVATGGGATALTFAPHVKQVIATDLTPKMLEAARTRIAPEAPNILFSDGDAENLPFVDNSFDLITCRIAPHHFPEPFKFVQEVARCLKPGGAFVLQDLTVPDDEKAARYINSFERLRDPSHARMYAEYEWRGMCLDADLLIEHTEIQHHPASMIEWAKMQDCDEATIQHLQILMIQAPAVVCEWLNICCAGTEDAAFDHVYIILRAAKPT